MINMNYGVEKTKYKVKNSREKFNVLIGPLTLNILGLR